MRRVLLIDQSKEHVAALKAPLCRRGFQVRVEDLRWRAIQVLRQSVPRWEFVVIVARGNAEEDVTLLRDLIVASQQFHQSESPEFLLAACTSCAPSLRIQIAQMGARYVRL